MGRKIDAEYIIKEVEKHFNLKNEIIFVFDDVSFSYSVIINETVPEYIKSISTEIIDINNCTYYIVDMPDLGVVQIYFDYNNDMYFLSYTNKQDLIKLIENLKESK